MNARSNGALLRMRDLHVAVEGASVLNGVDLTIQPGECHVLMGPNGSGKSSLAATLAGHPSYTVTEGTVRFASSGISPGVAEGLPDLLTLPPEARARAGLFLAFQHPTEVPGVSVRSFLKASLNEQRSARAEPPLSVRAFRQAAVSALDRVKLPESFLGRGVNERFSGGEKKRFEIAQLLLFQPRLAILDETDSGLDVDAVRTIGEVLAAFLHPEGVSGLHPPGVRTEEPALLLITHTPRLLKYVTPTHVHLMYHGRIAHSGGPELATRLDQQGYGWLEEYHG